MWLGQSRVERPVKENQMGRTGNNEKHNHEPIIYRSLQTRSFLVGVCRVCTRGKKCFFFLSLSLKWTRQRNTKHIYNCISCNALDLLYFYDVTHTYIESYASARSVAKLMKEGECLEKSKSVEHKQTDNDRNIFFSLFI